MNGTHVASALEMLEGRLLPRAFVIVVTIGLAATSAAARDPQRPPRARPVCGAIHKKCASAASQLAPDIALIAPVVTDAEGTTLVDVQVSVDGESLTTRLDGRPFPVAPGVHQFSFTARVGPWPGREVSTTQTLTIEQGQRGAIAISLPPLDGREPTLGPAASAPTSEPTEAETAVAPSKTPGTPEREASSTVRRGGGPSAFAYLLGGVGLLGVGAGGLLTYWGKTDNDALGACAPNCQPASVEHIRRLYLAADVSFAAGGAVLGLASLLFATSHFDVQPAHSGAFASFKGVF